MDLTVAICTYQRIEPFRETLASLCQCDPINQDWELLIIDNGCDPRVETLVGTFADRLPLRYIGESTLGTSHARNRAVREARSPVILFTDDDVTFDPGWLSHMAAAIHEHGDCDFWGGRVEPVWSVQPPLWFDIDRCAMLGDCVVRYQQGDQPRRWDSDHDPPFYTANLALRVERVTQAGYFDTTVGHRGGVRMGMEDSLMVQTIHAMGGRGWYAADAVVHHPVAEDRLTKAYARRFAWRQGWMSVEQVTRRPIDPASDRERDQRGSSSNPQAKRGTVPRWFYRVSIEQVAKGCLRWVIGLIRLNAAERFTGQFVAIFNLSKLRHALCRGR